MAEQLGTENLEKAVALFIVFVKTGVETQKDGFQVMDILQFIAPATSLPAVIAAWPKTKEEIDNLDLVELEKMRVQIEEGLNGTVSSEEAKEFILDAASWVAISYKGIQSGIKFFNKA